MGRVRELTSRGFRLAGHAYLTPKGLKFSYVAKHEGEQEACDLCTAVRASRYSQAAGYGSKRGDDGGWGSSRDIYASDRMRVTSALKRQ